MRSKKVTRYYCDHCSKGWFHKSAAARHEVICYRNSSRACLRCQGQARIVKPINERVGKDIESLGQECPDCLMAAVIQHNMRLDDDPNYDSEYVLYPKDAYISDRRAWDEEMTSCFNP